MNSIPPFAGQERPDTCALACLRMILAHYGTEISEPELVQRVDLHAGGINPEELALLARQFGLRTNESQLDHDDLARLVSQSKFPIVFLYRQPIDGADMVHAVIPIRFSRKYVRFLDPLRGERRVTIRKFEQARRLVGKWVVRCEPN